MYETKNTFLIEFSIKIFKIFLNVFPLLLFITKEYHKERKRYNISVQHTDRQTSVSSQLSLNISK